MKTNLFRSFHVLLALGLAIALAPAAEEARPRMAASYKPGGDTGIDFQGTSLMPKAIGHAVVSNKEGTVNIDAYFKYLDPARNFGTEFMTYVLWAVTPEGRASNIGELILDGGSADIKASAKFQSFGLFVTAEPHFAVGSPSTRLVLENVFKEKERFPIEPIDTNSSLINPIDYKAAGFEPMPVDEKVPSEVYQARNAVRIAKWKKADTYAPDAWAKAQEALQTAETALTNKDGKKAIVSAARVAVQTAEDAKTMAISRMAEEKVAADKRAAQDRLAAEQKAAADRLAAERRAAEEREAKAAAEQRAVMEAQKAQAATAQATAQAEVDRAKAATQKVRTDLMAQLNRVLATKDTDRGLMVTMAGVSFDPGKADLKPGARENLAKLSGIMMANPTLRLEIEGHTDNTGSEDTNKKLSLARARSVKDYLAEQGVSAESMTATGVGPSVPVADNTTSEGRDRNRRVEIIISGEAIGSLTRTDSNR